MTELKRILVLGGTGFVGRSVCARLVRRNGGAGGAVVVPTRRAWHADAIRSLPTVEPVLADIHHDATLRRLVADADAVINLVAILHGSAAAFETVHVDLPTRLAAACERAGNVTAKRRLIHVSALGVGPTARSNYLKSKAAGEAALRAARVHRTVLRPSVIFGEADRFLNLFAQMQALLPVVPLAGATAQFQPVWVEDVAEAIVRCLDTPETISRTIECAGPQRYTLAELVRLAGRWSGHERQVWPLPAVLGRLQALLLECLPGTPLMSRDNLASMATPNIATEGMPGLATLGIVPSGLAAVMPAVLDPKRGAASALDMFRAHARRD